MDTAMLIDIVVLSVLLFGGFAGCW
jgi:hypothetical protein